MDESANERRSALMSRIRGSETQPEILLRKELWRRGLRYRKNVRAPVGRPDIVIGSRKIAIFVDGCFWHGCPDHYVRPRSRESFWSAKLRENVERDIDQVERLEALGWTALRFWEHEVFTDLDKTADRVFDAATARQALSWRVVFVEPLTDEGAEERRHLRELRHLAPDCTVQQRRHTRKWNRNAPK